VEPTLRHTHAPDKSFDGGDLDCGNGLLLLIRKHIDPMAAGQLLEIKSIESSVQEDLPAWCRLTGNALVSWTKDGVQRSFLVRKAGELAPAAPSAPSAPRVSVMSRGPVANKHSGAPRAAPKIENYSVMGIGSWPRPKWMIRAIHDHISGRMPEDEFQATADDAVRLCIAAQIEAGADVVSDGEQRRDSYASFVGGRLDNAQLIPLSDLSAMVEDPEKFAEELRALDVPAQEVRHPVVFGPLGRSQPLTVHELHFAQSVTQRPIKVALPGPYLLTRTMWLDCLLDRAYPTREALATDVVRVLREEVEHLLASGVGIVQLDEPVLTEVVFTGAKAKRSFMCGALGEKGDAKDELSFARDLINGVVSGLPIERTALHICRGNWTRDENALLSGDYRPLLPFLKQLQVGTYFLETSTPRAGEIEELRGLPEDRRVGLGVVNPRSDRIEGPDEIVARVLAAKLALGRRPLFLNSDCGFATFADNPVASQEIAMAKLRSMAAARDRLRSLG
jgi:5-methyltetrahydropteroyltriglutamate--homocysteine methyltransferase